MSHGHCAHAVGDQTSVANRFGSENGFTRPQILENVLVANTSGGTLYMQVFEITNSLVPFGTAYSGGGTYSLTGLTVGHTYAFKLGANDTSTTIGSSIATTLTTAFAQATSTSFGGVSITTSARVNTLAVTSATGIVVGQQVTGTGIPSSVYVTAISGLNISVTPFYPSAASSGNYTFSLLNEDGTFIATGTSVTITGTASAVVTAIVTDLTVPQVTPAPASGSKPKFSFPVQSLLGGSLGEECYMSGIFCAWSSTQATYTAASASGSIIILVKD